MSRHKQKDLVEISSKIEEEASRTKATVILNDEEYTLKECGSLMSKVSRKGITIEVYTSQLRIQKKIARRLEAEAKNRKRAEEKERKRIIKEEKLEREWMSENLPSLSNFDLL